MSETFGSALREYRRISKISQRDLAAKTGLDFSYISKLENDRIPPPAADTIVLLCRIIGAPSEDLLALAGKFTRDVQRNISTSKSAQKFLNKAQNLDLTEEEWQLMIKSLDDLRGI